jgi:hypothetical protein
MKIPCFVIFDADGDENQEDRRKQHKRDNECLLKALAVDSDPFPEATIWKDVCVVWPHNLGKSIKASYADVDWTSLQNDARKAIDPQAAIQKNPAFIAEVAHLMWQHTTKPQALIELVAAIEKFSKA